MAAAIVVVVVVGLVVCVVYLVLVTLDMSHPSIGWLNELAPKNI